MAMAESPYTSASPSVAVGSVKPSPERDAQSCREGAVRIPISSGRLRIDSLIAASRFSKRIRPLAVRRSPFESQVQIDTQHTPETDSKGLESLLYTCVPARQDILEVAVLITNR